MDYAESILELVGNTPLVRLTRVTRELGPVERQPLILAKLETLNPGGSVKDRIGLPMIEAAERAGLLQPGGTIIEPTSGNTGHGLAIAAALKGYRCIFVMADKQSAEKQQLLRAYGAEVVLCPTNVAPESPESYYSRGRPAGPRHPRRVQARPVLEPGEPGGPRGHDRPRALAPDRRPDQPSRGQRRDRRHDQRRRPATSSVRTRRSSSIGADPEGSVLSGDTARPYLTEGIGEDFLPGTYDPAVVDRWVRVSDRDAFAAARRLTREEGILAGESCGTALVAVLDEARRIMAEDPAGAPDRVVVVILPDGGRSYLSKLYNDEWMRANGLMDRPGAVSRVAELLAARHHGPALPDLVVARTTQRVGEAIATLQDYGISQMPVSEAPDGDDLATIVGAISEKGLLDRAFRDPEAVERTVGEVMDRPLPIVDADASSTRRSVSCPAVRRPCWRSATGGRSASSPSSTCSSTSPTGRRRPADRRSSLGGRCRPADRIRARAA